MSFSHTVMTERWQESSRFSDAGSYYLQDLEIAAPEVGAAVAQLFVGDDADEWATGQVTHVHNGVYTVKYGDGHTVQFENDLQALKQAVFDRLPQIGARIRKGGFEPDPLELYPGTVHAVGRPRTGPAAGTLELKVKYDDGDGEAIVLGGERMRWLEAAPEVSFYYWWPARYVGPAPARALSDQQSSFSN